MDMKKIIFILFVFSSVLYSQWEQTSGPKGAHVTVILQHQDGTIYLGTDYDGIFKSTDGGNNWQDISMNQYSVEVTCMAYDNLYVYLGTNYYGIFRTSNQGLNWEPAAIANHNYISSMYAVQGRVYASSSSNSYLYVSTDYGNNWQLNMNKDVKTMIYHNGFLIAGCNNDVYRSSDFGNTWEQSDVIFQNMNYPEITANGNDLYLEGRSGVYRSSDNAQTWTQLNAPTAGYNNSITISNNDLFLASDSGLYKSSDFGNSWSEVNLTRNLRMFTRVKSAGDVLLAGTFLSLYRSVDSGTTWESVNFNFNRESITHVAAYGSNVFAGFLGGAFTSYNCGDVWLESFNNRERHGIRALDISENILYAGMFDHRLLKSSDNGLTWCEIPSDAPGGFRITAIDVKGEQILFGVTRNSAPVGGGIHYSSDNGLNWSVLGGSKNGVTDVAINNNYLYVASPLYLRGKDVSSSEWDTLINYKTNGIEISNNYIFAYTAQGLKRSSDNGVTWVDITNGLDTSNSFNDMLYFNNRLYIAFDSIFVSTNDGDRWYSINYGLSDSTITKIAANDKYIFAATGSGVWRCPIDIIVKSPLINSNVPGKYYLSQNYPNPFNPSTKIKFSIPPSKGARGMIARLCIYDILGREIAVLVNEGLKPGTYEVEWDASSYPSGVYFYKLNTGNYRDTKKMVLLK
jgi:photosystem II stability/assembly factor-like uncharacterized protein